MTESAKPLKLAVVGHTNVGKTSLLRTLTRDVGFGEVSHRPSTTRHVEGARLSVDGEPLLELYDTPGLEDAIALLDYLERLEQPGERLDGPARLARFLDASEARQRFEREYLVGLLKMTDGNVADAARLAQRNRTEFYRLLQKHALTPGNFKSEGAGGDDVADERHE